MARGWDASRTPPAIARLLPRCRARSRRLPDCASAPCAFARLRRAHWDHFIPPRLRGRKPESRDLHPSGRLYCILWHCCLQNTNGTYKLFMICTAAIRNLAPSPNRSKGDQMLTPKQKELLMFIHERLKETGVPPSFDEMKEALDLKSKSGIHRLITALEERGF